MWFAVSLVFYDADAAVTLLLHVDVIMGRCLFMMEYVFPRLPSPGMEAFVGLPVVINE